MELDDLRRRWKQPTATEAPADLDTAGLTKMLASGSEAPLSKMHRNLWLEIGFMVLCLLTSVSGLFYAQSGHSRAMLLWLIIICLLSGFYYRRKLIVLRCLNDASGALREHVARQLNSLRGLVHLYYQATMWSIPVSFGIGLVFLGGRITSEFSGEKLLVALSILAAVYIIIGGASFLVMRWFTRWYLQRLYGQHLDRLEGMLQELEE